MPGILARIKAEDRTVPEAVAREIPHIAAAVDLVVASFRAGGRLIYVGAGTSGRLGVLDASECPPTFGSDPALVQGMIAGGHTALVRAVEGAEDRAEDGAAAMDERGGGAEDTVVGIAASRRTPFVVAAHRARPRARRAHRLPSPARRASEFTLAVDVAICPVVGPEVLMGSTRMKAGTAQKLVLNMITTAAFVRIGKVYENMMVDLMANSQKLVERGRRTVMTVTGVDYEAAARAIEAAGGSVKTAIVMLQRGCDRATRPSARLARAGGFVRAALAEPSRAARRSAAWAPRLAVLAALAARVRLHATGPPARGGRVLAVVARRGASSRCAPLRGARTPGSAVHVEQLDRATAADTVDAALAAGRAPDLCELDVGADAALPRGGLALGLERRRGRPARLAARLGGVHASGDAIYGMPWVLDRACCSTTATCSRAPASTPSAPPETWDECAARRPRSSGSAAACTATAWRDRAPTGCSSTSCPTRGATAVTCSRRRGLVALRLARHPRGAGVLPAACARRA